MHGQVCSSTLRCVEVHRGMCRGVWGEQRCMEVNRGVCGGRQRVYRGMQRTV